MINLYYKFLSHQDNIYGIHSAALSQFIISALLNLTGSYVKAVLLGSNECMSTLSLTNISLILYSNSSC